jgi:phage-related tail fiber protein
VLLSDIWNAALSGTKREADIAFDARPDANTIHSRTSTNRQRELGVRYRTWRCTSPERAQLCGSADFDMRYHVGLQAQTSF